MILSVKDFDAIGDGKTLDTFAFQAAINAAKAGDTVYVPSGEYLLSSVFLKSDLRFEMAKDAVLVGSSDMGTYTPLPYDENNRYCIVGEGPYGAFYKHGMLCVYDSQNVEIVGGKILFDDLAFDEKRPLNPVVLDEEYIQGIAYIRQPSHYYFPKTRPTGLYISKSKNVTVKNVFFEKSPGFSVWILNSETLNFEGIKIKNSKYQWNGDGLHFSACRNAHISNCDIDASDDCVAIDGNYGGQSYGFVIKNCQLKTTMHVIRLYTGLDFGFEESSEGDYEKRSVHDITISDCTVTEGGGVLSICAFDGNVRNVKIENLHCRQKYEGTAISVSAKAGTISGLHIKNCEFVCNGIGYYCAEDNGKIDGIELENSRFICTPKTKYWGDDYPDGVATHSLSMPYALVAKNVGMLTLNNVTIDWNKAVFTDSLSKELQERVKARLGEEKLAQIEPRNICAVCNVNSNVIIKNCDIKDYKE